MKNGKYTEAKKKYQLAIQIDPTRAAYWSNLAVCFYNMGDFIAFKETAQKCVETDPAFIKGYYRLAKAHQLLYEFQEAAEVLEFGRAVDPDHPELKTLQKEIIERLEERKGYKEVMLSEPTEPYLPYFGGEGSGFTVSSRLSGVAPEPRADRPADPPGRKGRREGRAVGRARKNGAAKRNFDGGKIEAYVKRRVSREGGRTDTRRKTRGRRTPPGP